MFSAGIAYEAYSGEKYDDDQTDLTNHTFAISPEMWAVHKYQGSMDYLVGGQTQAMKRGITDLSFFGQYGSKKTNLRADIHMLGHANEVMYTDTDGNEVKYKPFGTEVDLVFKKVLAKGMVMKVGYSIMLPGADHLQLVDQKMESSGMYGIDSEVEQKTAQWFHVTFSFKPTFFKHEK